VWELDTVYKLPISDRIPGRVSNVLANGRILRPEFYMDTMFSWDTNTTEHLHYRPKSIGSGEVSFVMDSYVLNPKENTTYPKFFPRKKIVFEPLVSASRKGQGGPYWFVPDWINREDRYADSAWLEVNEHGLPVPSVVKVKVYETISGRPYLLFLQNNQVFGSPAYMGGYNLDNLSGRSIQEILVHLARLDRSSLPVSSKTRYEPVLR
jgi:hypothetical protein